MVFYFTSVEGHVVYMGRDKFENEDLLKWGWPEDVWFHVDNLSSAHVYLRMKPGETIETLSQELVMECCQLVKENSIEGKKKDRVKVVYTPYLNLHKSGDMDIGAVGFHDERKRHYVELEKDKDVLKRILKTKEERNNVNFQEEREKKIQSEKKERLAVYKAAQKEKQEVEKAKKEEEDRKYYQEYENRQNMKSNKTSQQNLEDDFM